MPYLNIDDDFTEHPKIDRLSDAAFRLHVSGIRFCAKNLTDGEVPKDRLRRIVPNFRQAALKELLGGDVWHEGGDGCGTKTCPIGDPDTYVVHDYLQWNKPASWWTGKRESDRRRAELHRDKQLRDAIRERDKDLCRYCGVECDFTARRGPKRGTYDHVDPNGPNTMDNLVVACGPCNSSKNDRTPEQAGMTLRPAPSQEPSQNRSGTEQDPDQTRPDKYLRRAVAPVVASSSHHQEVEAGR